MKLLRREFTGNLKIKINFLLETDFGNTFQRIIIDDQKILRGLMKTSIGEIQGERKFFKMKISQESLSYAQKKIKNSKEERPNLVKAET